MMKWQEPPTFGQGEAICHECDQPLDWTPTEIMPGAYYVCSSCETKLLAKGSMIRVGEFFGEWDLFDADGRRVIVG